MFVNTISLEPFQISSCNFFGNMIRSKSPIEFENGCIPMHSSMRVLVQRLWYSSLFIKKNFSVFATFTKNCFDMYVGRQAVLVMACENLHMSDDLVLDPGIVMIFAHGVEWPLTIVIELIFITLTLRWTWFLDRQSVKKFLKSTFVVNANLILVILFCLFKSIRFSYSLPLCY